MVDYGGIYSGGESVSTNHQRKFILLLMLLVGLLGASTLVMGGGAQPQGGNAFTFQSLSADTNQMFIFRQTADLSMPLSKWQVITNAPYASDFWITNVPAIGPSGFFLVQSSNTLAGVGRRSGGECCCGECGG